jgi:hypothetical protein
LGRRHIRRCRQVISQRRIKEFLGGVFSDLFCVFLIDGLISVAAITVLRVGGRGREQREQNTGEKYTADPT